MRFLLSLLLLAPAAAAQDVLVTRGASGACSAAWAETETLRAAVDSWREIAAESSRLGTEAETAAARADSLRRVESDALRLALWALSERAAICDADRDALRRARDRPQPLRLGIGASIGPAGPGVALGVTGELPLPLLPNPRFSLYGSVPVQDPAHFRAQFLVWLR
ncbi:MAG: hypothetical protein AAF791_05475 [Bacteroidota bacterium]